MIEDVKSEALVMNRALFLRGKPFDRVTFMVADVLMGRVARKKHSMSEVVRVIIFSTK